MTKYKIFEIVISLMLLCALFLGCVGDDGSDDNGENGEPDKKEKITVILPDKEQKTIFYSDLSKMTSIERNVSFQNKLGNFVDDSRYKAVPIKDILAASSSGTRTRGNPSNSVMKPGDTLKIIANDGWTQEYCYYNVYPPDSWYRFQGDFCLAYAMDGTSAPDWETGPMSVFLPLDCRYSSEDCNATSAPDQGYFKSISAGARFVKNVEKIEVISNSVDEWEIELSGAISETFTKTDFEMLEFYYSSSVVNDTGSVWSGVPLWHIVGRIDDDGPIRGEGVFNETKNKEGYEIKITAGDSYSNTITSSLIAKNDKIILVSKINDLPLSDDKKPVRIFGEGLKKSQMVGNIVKIELEGDGNGDVGPVAITVIGKKTIDYSMSKLKSLTGTTGTGGYKKSTGTMVGPYTYKGVTVSYLLDEAGYIGDSYSLEVSASDGYFMTYSKAQVNGQFITYDTNGDSLGMNEVTLLLAYEEVGESELSGGPLRIVIVSDDTSITDSHFWVKDVVQLKLVEPVLDWDIELHGITDYKMNRTSFEALATCSYHKMWYNYTDKDDVAHHYQVVPLWILISIVDGISAPNNFYFFNDFLADLGYNISIAASDGFTIQFTSQRVVRNDSILVAYKDDDKPLSMDAGWPLRIVGPMLSGKESIRNIKYINMTDIPGINEWSFNLTGLTKISVTQSFFIAMASHHMVWCNISEKGVDKHYQGIPLYYLLGAVDDGDEQGHFGLNMTLALLGYDVVIKAADDFTAEFDSVRVARNNSIILAYLNDGLPLNTSEGGPVRLVGPSLTGKERVKNIVDISLKNISEVSYSPDILKVKGKRNLYAEREVNVSLPELKGFPSYTGSGGFKNKVGTITGPINYTGVNISSLLWLVDGIEVGDSVRITSSDGYNRTFDIDQINGVLEIFDQNGTSLGTGTVTPVLAYSEEDGDLSDGGPLRLVFVDINPKITASGFWLKDVVMVEVID